MLVRGRLCRKSALAEHKKPHTTNMEGFYIISIIIQKPYMKSEYGIVIIMVMVMIIVTIINIPQTFNMSNIL